MLINSLTFSALAMLSEVVNPNGLLQGKLA